ncbi:Ig-like domain-containing protein [Pseudomonas aeruginosa]|nr:Ig-like domain-containing protein [Pseudomonas aeruginosa]
MSIQAKVTPIDQSISSAAAVEVPENGILKLSQSSNVALDVAPESVAGYSKSGSDLIVQLKTGESVRIANFYAEGQPSSQLFLADKDKLVAVDLPPVAADGPLMAGYIPQESLAGFESLTGAGVLGGMSAGTALLVGAAAIGAGVAISNSSGGGGGGGSSVPPDTTPPKAASGLKIAPDGSSISGQAEAGASVGIDTNGDGKPDLTVIADANGNFTAPLNPPLTNGQTVTVVVTDPAGNASPPAQVTAPDTTAPAPATDVQVAPDGSSVTGKAEPGSTVGVDTDGDGQPDTTVVVGPGGSFEVPLNPPLTNGETVTVIVTDPAGNNSTPVTVEAPDTTAPAPATDVQVAPDGSSVTGNAEPGATVGVDTDGDGQPDTTVVVGPGGSFEVPLNPPLTNGETVTVIVTDPAGNSSTPVTAEAPDFPDAPQVNASNGSVLSGTAEAGVTIVITDGNGNPIGQTSADANGNWSFTPGSQLPDGTVVNVVARDAAGNSSPATSITVDGVAPNAPVVEPSNGSELSGTAEPGSSVTLTDGNGNPIGQTTADANGNWSFTPSTPLPDGTVVNVVARDAAGNSSPPASVTVDAVAPATPTVDPSNGTTLSGTAEPGATVTLTDGNGNPIGQVTADGSGNWTFTPSTPLPNGTVVNATATDPSGNASSPASVTVDAVAPATPVVNPSNGTTLSGTAEPGATVTLADGNGNPIGQVTADGSGNWSFTPTTPLPNGTVVNATATDASGNTSAGSSVTVDSVAPATPVINPSNGTTLSGTAEPGSSVTLTDGNGNPIGQVTADGSGNWSFTPSTPLADGTVVNATATDPAGNTSGQGSTTVDGVAPTTPTVNLSNGSSLSGTAEPGSTVILTDGNGNPIAEVTADGSGNWTYTPSTPIANGTVVNVVAQDAASNSSPPATVTVDSSAPPAPVINPSNGVVISGTAEAGATVTLTDAGGNPIGQVTADGSGNWSFTPGTPLANGTVIVATATDPTGNTGPQAATTVDAVAPPAPVIDPSNGTTISGTAEAGAKVILTDGNGNPIGETTADGSGNWTFTPATPLANGTVVNAVAQDPAGNTGPQGSTTVDAVAPNTPVVNPSNGNLLNGTAEPGSTVTLTDGNGNPIGQTTADGSGNWSFTPGSQLPNGTVVNVTASDAAGNTSPPATTTVDSSLPSIPQVDPSNGSVISGTADAGNTIIITDGNGNPIGQVTADGSGNWSFTPGIPLPDGTVVNVVARSPSNVDSAPAVITVDGVAPAAPVIDPSNGTEISGTAEAGATVILTDGGGNPIGQATADGSGNWTFTPSIPLANGTVINAVAQDPAGNTSGPASVTVDAIAPPAPVINPSNGVVISGTAEAGATVILTDGNGNPIGQVTADGSGNWAFTPATPLANGTVINALAQDAAGNTSGPASTTVDSVAPATPVLDPSNGTVISGTAEAGAMVILTDGGGNPIGQATADGSGNWSFTPGTPLTNGTVINAVAQDAAGNTSGPVSTTVDAVAPATPVIDPSNGVELSGTAEPGVRVILTDGNGNPIGQTLADGSGNWTFTPGTPLANGTVVNAVAQDPAGNTSGPAITTVDTVAPATPVINASNGSVITGTAEAGAKVILTDGNGNPIGETTADGSGNWTFTPGTPLANGTVINAVAEDAAGNASGPASTTVDSVAPSAPLLSISADGALLTGTAEPNSQVRIVVNGDTANPITVTVDGAGNFSLPFAPPLITGELIAGVAVDAAGNVSGPATINAPDLAPPTISVPEAADTWINAAEIGDGIQVDVTVRPTMQVGQVVTVKFAGQNGYEAEVSHTLTAGDIAAGNLTLTLTLTPPGGMGPFPEGASTVTADINGGTASTPVPFTIDTIPPATPVLSLVGNILTISAEPGTELTVTVDVGGVTATATVTADNSGLASLNLLTDLDIDFSWDQLLNAQVSVVGRDPAGNPSNTASIGVGTSIEQPVTIGNFGLDVSLNPLNPRFGFSGTTEPDSSVVIRVITPALNVELLPIQADSSGNFSLNLLSPTILTQLGLNITDILNLGSQISFNLVSTDSNGNDSAAYGITLTPNGLSLNIGQIDVNGTSGDDVLSGANGSSEHINGGDGSDLIFNVGTGDHVVAGNGNDTIQITATDFVSIDGGAGFDTLVLANGIDLDYNAVGVGTLSNLERIDLGKGDSGSVLTLTAAEVDAITDANNTLQITGENNDTLNVVGAVNTGTTQLINGITYDVYTFGSTTLLIEDNTVQVVV